MQEEEITYFYKGKIFPVYLKHGNAMQYISAVAQHFCRGNGLDIGSNKWPLPGARSIDNEEEFNAYRLPGNNYDYIFSSHCLEHLPDPVGALRLWMESIKSGGRIFLYLPHPDMEYWLPQNNSKHLHTWTPEQMTKLFSDLGLTNILSSQRDAYWSFFITGVKSGPTD